MYNGYSHLSIQVFTKKRLVDEYVEIVILLSMPVPDDLLGFIVFKCNLPSYFRGTASS